MSRTGHLGRLGLLAAVALLAIVALRLREEPREAVPASPSPVPPRLAQLEGAEATRVAVDPPPTVARFLDVVNARGRPVSKATTERRGDEVVVRAPGHVERRVPSRTRRVVLAEIENVRGVVRGSNGEPCPTATVTGFGLRTGFPHGVAATIDDGGFFAFAWAAGPDAWIRVDGRPSLGIRTVTVPPSGTVDVTLAPPESLTGRVTDSDGSPIPDAEVELSDATWHHASESSDGTAGPIVRLSTRSGADGSFTFSLPGRTVCRLVATAHGRRWWARTLVLPSTDWDGEIRLDSGSPPPPMRAELPDESFGVHPVFLDSSGRVIWDLPGPSAERLSGRVTTWTWDFAPPLGTTVRFRSGGASSRSFPVGSDPIAWAPSRWQALRVRLAPREGTSPEESPVYSLHALDEDAVLCEPVAEALVGSTVVLDRLDPGTTGLVALAQWGADGDLRYAPDVPEVVVPHLGLAPAVQDVSLDVVPGRRIVGRVEPPAGAEEIHGAAWRVLCHVDGLIRARTEEFAWPRRDFFLDVPDRDVRLTLVHGGTRRDLDVPREQATVVLALGEEAPRGLRR
jgi:hypothetical protein